jgi:hypothetical protein
VIRLEGTITYTDGREERIEVHQAEYADYELWAIRHGLNPAPDASPPMTMTRYLGYAAAERKSGRPPGEWVPFEEWGGLVADVTLDAPPEGFSAEAPPFPPVRSAG